MYIQRLYLENHKKIKAGTGKDKFSLQLTPGINLIQGPNGVGKSTILSELTPFPSDASNWEGHGVKEMYFILDKSEYHVVYHWYNGKRGEAFLTRDFESMVTKNTFAAVVEALTLQLGLDPNFEALSHLSSYDNKSFALLQPAERKKFLATIVQNLDVYQNIYKTLSKRSSIFKAMVGTLNAKIANLGGNPLNFGELIRSHQLTIDALTTERESIMAQILSYKKTPEELAEYNENVKLEKELTEQYSKLMAESRTRVQAFMESFHYTVTLDEASRDLSIKERDLEDFTGKLADYEAQKRDLESGIHSCSKNVYQYGQNLATLLASEDYKIYQTSISDEYQEELHEARAYVQIGSENVGTTLHSDAEDIKFVRDHFDEKTMKTFLALYSQKYKEYCDITQSINNINPSTAAIVKTLPRFMERFCVDGVISSTRILAEKHRLYCKLFESTIPTDYSGNVIIDTLDEIDNFVIYFNECREIFQAGCDLEQLFDTFQIPENFRKTYFSTTDDWKLYKEDFLGYYDHLTLYIKYENFLNEHAQLEKSRKTGKDISKDIEDTRAFITQNTEQRNKYQNELIAVDESIEELNIDIELCKKTITWLKILEKLRENIDSIRDRLEILRQVIKPMPDLFPLQERVQAIDAQLKSENDIVYKLRYSSDLYDEYIHELTALETNYSRIETLKKYCSPSSGIQIIFIDLYINKILEMANSLLSKFFEGKFVIQPFKITDKEFRIPVTKDGFLIDDISSLSTSQMTIVNMCICFAIMMHSSSKMNILRLDEMDAPLDDVNSYIFPNLIDVVMKSLKCEQAFIITHNEMMDGDNRYKTIQVSKN